MNKTKVLVAGAFVFVLVIGSTVFASSSDPGSTTDPIAAKSYVDTQLNAKAGNLQNQLNAANKTISDLQTKVKALEDKMANQSPTQPTQPVPKPTPAPTTPSYKTGKVTATSLNVRSGPSISNARVGSLKNGTQVTIISSKSSGGATWHQIKAGSVSGWVHGGYVKIN